MDLLEIKILGCSGVCTANSFSCSVLSNGKQICKFSSMGPEISRPSFQISRTSLTFSLKGETSLSVTFPSSLLPKAGKVWVPLYRSPRTVSSLSQKTKERLLLYTVKAHSSPITQPTQESEKDQFLKPKFRLKFGSKENQQRHNKKNPPKQIEKVDERFMKLVSAYSMNRYISRTAPSAYRFNNSPLSLYISNDSLFCKYKHENWPIQSFFDTFRPRSKSIDSLNQLIHSTVTSVRNKLPK